MEMSLHVLEAVTLKYRGPGPDTQSMGVIDNEVIVDVVTSRKEKTKVGATEKPCTFL